MTHYTQIGICQGNTASAKTTFIFYLRAVPDERDRAGALLRDTLDSRVGCPYAGSSDTHRHDYVPVFVIVALGGAELAGGLGILQLQANFAGAGGFQELNQVRGVEADG